MKPLMGMALAALTLTAAIPALAGDAKLGDLQVKSAWARATAPKAAAGGAFLDITNGGGTTDNLLSAESPVAKTVELHAHIHQGDVMRMVAVSNIEIQPGKTVSLAPGGLHIMLIGLHKPLTQGETFPLTLDFARAGKVTVTVDVAAIGATQAAPAAMMHDHGNHDQHMQDPAMKAMHDEHMKDPAMKAMHDKMHDGHK